MKHKLLDVEVGDSIMVKRAGKVTGPFVVSYIDMGVVPDSHIRARPKLLCPKYPERSRLVDFDDVERVIKKKPSKSKGRQRDSDSPSP